MTRTIAVIGSLNIDFITRTPRVPARGETLTATSSATGFGGKGANQAVACARLSRSKPKTSDANGSNDTSDTAKSLHDLDVKTCMVGAVGTDSFGDDFINALRDEGISKEFVRQVEGQRTGIANIIVEEGTGENRILIVPNANAWEGSGLVDLVPAEADVVVFQLEIPLPLVIHNMKLARSQGKYVILNPAPAQKLPDDVYAFIDCLIMNETETDILREAATPLSADNMETFEGDSIARGFFEKGVRDLVVITLGSKGVYYSARTKAGALTARTTGHVQGKKVKVVDTTAAGDTFVGALAVQIALNEGTTPEDPMDVIAHANRAAAKTVEKAGAMTAIPWLDEVELA